MTSGASQGPEDAGRVRRSRFVDLAILGALAVLLLNPSGIIGSRIGTWYQGWQEKRRIASSLTELASVSSYLGPSFLPDRGVIVEFVAYDCPACQTIAPAVSEAARSLGVTVVVRHVPSKREDSASAEAALAAICAEQYDVFPEAHEMLLSEDAWLKTRDWAGFGTSLGISDPEAFVACLDEEATRHRLARDLELADILQISGTPTFVSSQKLYLGTRGLASALADVASASPADFSATLRPEDSLIFDSSQHTSLSEQLQSAIAGFFLSDSVIALVDRTEIHFVDLSSREHRVVGREGPGPKEFGNISRAFRTSDGIAVHDGLRRRVVSITREGEFGYSQGYLHADLRNFSARSMARHPDGSFVFRDGNGSERVNGSGGRFWAQTRYVTVDSDDVIRMVAQARGGEMYDGERFNDRVVLGHRTLEAATPDHLIVAETERAAIAILDWDGRQVASIPMPAGVSLSPDEVKTARELASARLRGRFARFMGRTPISADWTEEDLPTLPPDWPANEVAPPVDMMLTDFDSRLWVRDYQLPGQDSVTWRVWDIERQRLLFTARLDHGETLLDALGDQVLLRRRDAFDGPRPVITRLSPG